MRVFLAVTMARVYGPRADTVHGKLALQLSRSNFALTSCWSSVPAPVANAPSAEKGFGQVKDGGDDDVLIVLEDAQAAHVLAPFRQKRKEKKKKNAVRTGRTASERGVSTEVPSPVRRKDAHFFSHCGTNLSC